MKILVSTSAGVRYQSGVIPYRVVDGEVEIMLINTTHSNDWGIPKGGLEPGLKRKVNAAKEAYEEAGIKGVVGNIIGMYTYIKGSTSKKQNVFVYGMVVTRELREWPEAHRRVRKWVSAEEAQRLLPKKIAKLVKQLVKSV